MPTHAREERHEKHALSCFGLEEFDPPYHAVAQARLARCLSQTSSAHARGQAKKGLFVPIPLPKPSTPRQTGNATAYASLSQKFAARMVPWQRDRNARAQGRFQRMVNRLAIVQTFSGHFAPWSKK